MDIRFRFSKSFKKLGFISVLSLALVFSQVNVASAQVGGVVSDPPVEAWALSQQPKEAARLTLAGSVFTYLVNLTSFAVDRLAYDAAVMIASGGPAESPLYDGTPVEAYFKEYGAAVAGESIGLLQDDLESSGGTLGAIFSGFDLCQPRADITIALNLGIKGVFDRPTPKCDFKAIQNNWQGFVADVQQAGTPDAKNRLILAKLADAFDPQENEFSVGIELQSSVVNKALQDSFLKANVKIKEDGFQPVTNFITGNEETPAELINKTYLTKQEDKTQSRLRTINALQSNSDALLQIGIHAGSMFTNTLLSEFTQKLYSGLFDFETLNPDPFANIETIAQSNAQSVRDQYRSLLAFTPLEITNYSILSDFSSCPSGVARGLYNCVANSSFISAIGRADAGAPMTVAEAIEAGLLDGGWPLIPSTDLARNQDPFCYTYGFCHTNLVKLRKARVISIGWEMAAESMYNSASDTVTLQEVVDGFDDCNTAGEADINHPWCKLIDPNWVLKYPETQCKALVNGQLLTSSASDERQQECVDMPSCISENDDGTCTGGYGYCVKEENTWRFRGESCPAQYASCLTFASADKEVSYLQTTVDYADCSADNAGCLWYDTKKADPENDGTYDWQPVDDVAVADAASDAYTSRIYFTSAVEGCTAENGGCSELVQRDSALRLNVIQNPSFEDDTNNDTVPDGWLRNNTSVTVDSTGVSHTGTDAMSLGAANIVTQPGIAVAQGRFYTLSYYARQKVDGNVGVAQALLEFLAVNPGNDIDLTATSFVPEAGTTCVVADSGNVANGNGQDDAFAITGQPAGTDYVRYSCTFTSPIVTDSSSLIIAALSFKGNVFIDDIQLEQGEDASSYHIGYSTVDLTSMTVKVPPAYLGCKGDDTDPADCANYAQVCSENDVGCTAYTPTNGDPTVTGVATELDACPSACVGYDTFMQEPTLYEPEGDFPVYFIPSTGETCAEENVGCDQFTNLTDESLEYYTSLRACVTGAQAATNTNSDQSATFYTWEGSDLEGYQLKTWQLLESNMSSTAYTYVSGGVDLTPNLAPCATWTATADGIVCSDTLDTDGDLHKDWDVATCDDHNDIFTNPDCREFYDANGGIHYREWSKTVTVNDACVAYRKTDVVGIDVAAQTVNCQNSGGYFDAALGSCRYNGYSEESLSCPEAANGCRSYTGGRSRNSRLVLEDTLEEGNLNNWDAASAADVTLSNESLATGGHSIAATNQFSTFIFDQGAACTNPAGCAGTAQSLGGTCTVVEGNEYCGTLEGQLYQGKTYTISFWAKGSGTLTAAFDMNAVPGSPVAELAFGTVDLTSGWQEFSLGPLNMSGTDYPSFGPDTTLVFDPTSLAYIDNITLREGEDNITVIKNSWVTPAECDQSPTGAVSPQYYLGCQEYQTQTSETAYLKSFSRLCSPDKVGCEDFFATHETDSPYAEVHQATCSNPSGLAVQSPTSCYYENDGAGNFDTTSQFLCTIGIGQVSCDFDLDWYESQLNLPSHISYGPSTVVVPADSDVFLVVNDDVTCSSAYAGCTELGKPIWSQDRNSTTGADSVYLINDPDTYTDTLCNDGELFCEAWDTDKDGTFYFKDPGDQTCDYRTGVQIGGSDYDGWFRTGTDEFCYGTCTDGVTSCSSDAQCGAGTCNTTDPSYVINGTLSGVWRNGDADYLGWVGQCGAENNTCSEFQDPLDLETDQTYQEDDGKQYFYLNNENLDENVLPDSQRCNGQVSLKEGCALFNDTSEPAQGYNASASEVSSTHADAFYGRSPYALVDPIDCETGDSTLTLADGTQVDLCAQRCIYDKGLVNDITDGVSRGTKLQEEITNNTPDKYGYAKLYLTGTSCFDVSDCGTMRSESGAEISALDCAPDARVTRADASPTGVEERTAVARLENDTNTILKVNRDRQCSEWLSCAEDQASWDERSASWKTVCSDLVLCSEYSSVLGGTSFCSKIKDDEPEIVLTNDVYTARDTSWYGQEYSGYAIPDLYPVQTLEQANVAPPPGFCDLSAALKSGEVDQTVFDAHHGDACTDEVDCGGNALTTSYCVGDDKQDYRLALVAGSCSGRYGSECSVGYCANTGAACSTSNDCGTDGGNCLAGSCQEVTTTLCTTDANCAEDQMCSGGLCVVPGNNVTIEEFNSHPNNPNASCSGGRIFAGDINLQTGSCIREQCVLTPTGQTFNVATSEGKLCRAQPEANSPFEDALVDRWLDPDSGTPKQAGEGYTPGVGEPSDDVPYSIRTGFENANFCNPGEECSCTYRKITFGDSGAVRYWDDKTPVPDSAGICSQGKENMYCDQDSDCDTDPANNSDDGVCSLISREDVLLGLEGYCLEKDTGVNINGDRAQGACLTWLPVDQLAGSTDLYAKFTEAGYFKDAFACTDVRAFVNLTMSDHNLVSPDSIGSIACAHSDQGNISKEEAYDLTPAIDECASNVQCPNGYWAMMGMPSWKDSGVPGTTSSACHEGGTEGNDCPYVCIPEDATVVDAVSGDTESCNPDSAYVQSLLDSLAPLAGGAWQYDASLANDVKFVGSSVAGLDLDASDDHYLEFDAMIRALESCSLKGLPVETALVNNVMNFDATDGCWTSINPGLDGVSDFDGNCDANEDDIYELNGEAYRSLGLNGEFYPGCMEVAKVSDSGTNEGYAWTDRLLGPKNYSVQSAVPGLDGITKETATGDFGFAEEIPNTASPSADTDSWPFAVATCEDASTKALHIPFGNAPFNDCLSDNQQSYTTDSLGKADDPSVQLIDRIDPSSPIARSFVNFTFAETRTSLASWVVSPGADPFDVITQLFAGIAGSNDNYFTWNDNGGSWPSSGSITVDRTYTPSVFSDTATSDVRADQGNPPTVWSLLSGSCVGTECEEGDANSLTLNDQNNGDIQATSFLRAYLKFYAAADKNQLPIRRVIIDWGDELVRTDGFQGSDSEDNFYKNHRGLDSGTDNSICDLNNEWGETPESCDPNYFSYSHVYTCKPEVIEDNARACTYDARGVVTNSPCWVENGVNGVTDRSCVFQPAVHIRDNWGWCTGECTADGEPGCFEGDVDTLASPDNAYSECGYAHPRAPGGTIDPWVYYDGTVIVDPQ